MPLTTKISTEVLEVRLDGAQKVKLGLQGVEEGQDKVEKSTKKTDGAMSNLGGKLKKWTKDFGGLAAGMAGVAGAAAALGKALSTIKGGVNFAADFENEFAMIKTLNAGIGEDLKKNLLELSKTLPQQAGDITKATYDAISAGIDPSQVTGFLEAASATATAAGSTMTEAVGVLTAGVNAFASQGETADSVANKLFATVKGGVTTIPQLSAVFGRATASASSFGIPLHEVLGAIAQLTKQGVPTAEAVTRINALIAELSKASGQAAKSLKKHNVEIGVSALKQKGLVGVLKEINAATNGNASELAKLTNSQEALQGMLKLTGEGMQGYIDQSKTIQTDTTAATAAQKELANTFRNSQKLYNNARDGALRQMGKEVLPALRDVLVALTRDLNDNGSAFKKFGSFLGGVITACAALVRNLTNIGVAVGIAFAVKKQAVFIGMLTKLQAALVSFQATVSAQGMAGGMAYGKSFARSAGAFMKGPMGIALIVGAGLIAIDELERQYLEKKRKEREGQVSQAKQELEEFKAGEGIRMDLVNKRLKLTNRKTTQSAVLREAVDIRNQAIAKQKELQEATDAGDEARVKTLRVQFYTLQKQADAMRRANRYLASRKGQEIDLTKMFADEELAARLLLKTLSKTDIGLKEFTDSTYKQIGAATTLKERINLAKGALEELQKKYGEGLGGDAPAPDPTEDPQVKRIQAEIDRKKAERDEFMRKRNKEVAGEGEGLGQWEGMLPQNVIERVFRGGVAALDPSRTLEDVAKEHPLLRDEYLADYRENITNLTNDITALEAELETATNAATGMAGEKKQAGVASDQLSRVISTANGFLAENAELTALVESETAKLGDTVGNQEKALLAQWQTKLKEFQALDPLTNEMVNPEGVKLIQALIKAQMKLLAKQKAAGKANRGRWRARVNLIKQQLRKNIEAETTLFRLQKDHASKLANMRRKFELDQNRLIVENNNKVRNANLKLDPVKKLEARLADEASLRAQERTNQDLAAAAVHNKAVRREKDRHKKEMANIKARLKYNDKKFEAADKEGKKRRVKILEETLAIEDKKYQQKLSQLNALYQKETEHRKALRVEEDINVTTDTKVRTDAAQNEKLQTELAIAERVSEFRERSFDEEVKQQLKLFDLRTKLMEELLKKEAVFQQASEQDQQLMLSALDNKRMEERGQVAVTAAQPHIRKEEMLSQGLNLEMEQRLEHYQRMQELEMHQKEAELNALQLTEDQKASLLADQQAKQLKARTKFAKSMIDIAHNEQRATVKAVGGAFGEMAQLAKDMGRSESFVGKIQAAQIIAEGIWHGYTGATEQAKAMTDWAAMNYWGFAAHQAAAVAHFAQAAAAPIMARRAATRGGGGDASKSGGATASAPGGMAGPRRVAQEGNRQAQNAQASIQFGDIVLADVPALLSRNGQRQLGRQIAGDVAREISRSRSLPGGSRI